jgi:hypothetical protein
MSYIVHINCITLGLILLPMQFSLIPLIYRFFNIFPQFVIWWVGIAQLVQRLHIDWTVWDSNPTRGRFSAPIHTGPGAKPASCTMRKWSFSRVKRLGRDADQRPLTSAEVKDSRAASLLPLRVFMSCYSVKFTLTSSNHDICYFVHTDLNLTFA